MNEQFKEFTVNRLKNDYGQARQIYQFMELGQFAIIDKKVRQSLITLNNRKNEGRRYRTKFNGEMYTVVLEYIPAPKGKAKKNKE